MSNEIDAVAERYAGDVASKPSRGKAYVRFINSTNRPVELMWINFTGKYVTYQVLPKGGFVDINTYTRHPWIALDYHTRDRLKIDNTWTYFAQTTKQFFRSRYPERVIPDDFEIRIRAVINVALHSLRYLSLLAVRNSLSFECQANELDLPKVLIKDLKKVISQRDYQIALEKLRQPPR